MAITSAIGLTSTVAVIGLPGQPFAVVEIVKVTIIGAFVVLVSIPLISPEPVAAMPVTKTILSLVQLKPVPVTLPLRTIFVIASPEKMVWDKGEAIEFGVGFTRTVAVMAAPGQLLALGVIVKVTVTGAKVVLVNVPVISPVPVVAMPVTETVLSLLQE